MNQQLRHISEIFMKRINHFENKTQTFQTKPKEEEVDGRGEKQPVFKLIRWILGITARQRLISSYLLKQ